MSPPVQAFVSSTDVHGKHPMHQLSHVVDNFMSHVQPSVFWGCLLLLGLDPLFRAYRLSKHFQTILLQTFPVAMNFPSRGIFLSLHAAQNLPEATKYIRFENGPQPVGHFAKASVCIPERNCRSKYLCITSSNFVFLFCFVFCCVCCSAPGHVPEVVFYDATETEVGKLTELLKKTA